ncbi:hypothetical protein KAX02_00500 [candidate division WOR-3 bacterium]|nr:hypothetical protein [candidate division WOR-3 bacterium]
MGAVEFVGGGVKMIKIISTAGNDMYVFTDMRVYRRLFNANSDILIYLPNMNTAG